MHDSLRVGRRQPTGDVNSIIHRFGGRESPTGKSLPERFSDEQFHHRVELATFGSDVVDAKHIGMIEGCHRLGLAAESVEPFRLSGPVSLQNLHGHETIQPGVQGFPNFPHAARPERLDNFIGAKMDARLENHEKPS